MAKTSWEAYRRHRRTFHALWFGGFTVVAGIIILALPLLGRFAMPFILVAGPLFLSAWLVAALSTSSDFVQSVACPKCDGSFFAGKSYFGSLRRRCAHCGSPKGADPRS